MELIQDNIDWLLPNLSGEEKSKRLLAEVPQLHPVIAEILSRRGILDYDGMRDFFNPDLSTIDDFGKMLNIERAADRVVKAIESNDHILLYGDYDVDGTCAVSIFYQFLESLSADVSFYIPDRYSEGYGVSEQGVEAAIERKASLMITLDCGITANDTLKLAQDAGIDVIICDHHLPGPVLPPVFAVLNPHQHDCDFDGLELCGCGVGLMLIREISQKLDMPDAWEAYLSFTAIATACDIVPMRGINRILVAQGMKQLVERPPKGVRALVCLEENDPFTIKSVSDVVFGIGPKINAAGRLEHASLAVDLFTKYDDDVIAELAAKINELNTKRKDLDAGATQEALRQIEAWPDAKMRNTTVVYGQNWNKGIIGIVASRLIEVYYRPTIVFTESNGMLTGSVRSVDGFDVHKSLLSCSAYFEKFGGHAAAAGITMKKEKLDGFVEAFERVVSSELKLEQKKPTISVDALVNFKDWNNGDLNKFMAQMNRMRPFGPGNLPIVFATDHCLAKDVRVLKGEHLKFMAFQPGDEERTLPVIAFKMAEYADALRSGAQFRLGYSVEVNTWKGRSTIQGQAKAILLQAESYTD